jgi:hypothetical protein
MITKRTDDIVDLGSAYSFPASDPPSFMGSTAIPGQPQSEEEIKRLRARLQRVGSSGEGALSAELEGTLEDEMNLPKV